MSRLAQSITLSLALLATKTANADPRPSETDPVSRLARIARSGGDYRHSAMIYLANHPDDPESVEAVLDILSWDGWKRELPVPQNPQSWHHGHNWHENFVDRSEDLSYATIAAIRMGSSEGIALAIQQHDAVRLGMGCESMEWNWRCAPVMEIGEILIGYERPDLPELVAFQQRFEDEAVAGTWPVTSGTTLWSAVRDISGHTIWTSDRISGLFARLATADATLYREMNLYRQGGIDDQTFAAQEFVAYVVSAQLCGIVEEDFDTSSAMRSAHGGFVQRFIPAVELAWAHADDPTRAEMESDVRQALVCAADAERLLDPESPMPLASLSPRETRSILRWGANDWIPGDQMLRNAALIRSQHGANWFYVQEGSGISKSKEGHGIIRDSGTNQYFSKVLIEDPPTDCDNPLRLLVQDLGTIEGQIPFTLMGPSKQLLYSYKMSTPQPVAEGTLEDPTRYRVLFCDEL